MSKTYCLVLLWTFFVQLINFYAYNLQYDFLNNNPIAESCIFIDKQAFSSISTLFHFPFHLIYFPSTLNLEKEIENSLSEI